MLGEKLRQIRKENNMTKQELSVALNVPKERIKLYEAGEEIPSDFYLSNFTQYFKISKEELNVCCSDPTGCHPEQGEGSVRHEVRII